MDVRSSSFYFFLPDIWKSSGFTHVVPLKKTLPITPYFSFHDLITFICTFHFENFVKSLLFFQRFFKKKKRGANEKCTKNQENLFPAKFNFFIYILSIHSSLLKSLLF